MNKKIDRSFEPEGYCTVVRHMTPELGMEYVEQAGLMSIIWDANGPVGNGRLHEFVFRARPSVIFDFADIMAIKRQSIPVRY